MNGQIRSRKTSKIYGENEVTSKEEVKYGNLLKDLLLFETVVVQTQRLNELPYLVESFGFGPVRDLIRSSTLEFSLLNPQVGVRNSGGTAWKFECGAFAFVDLRSIVRDSLQEIRERIPVGKSQFRRLEEAVQESIKVDPKEDVGSLSEQFRNDITKGGHALYNSLENRATSKFDVEIDSNDIEFNAEYIGKSEASGFDVFEIDTNLDLLINANPRKAIDLVGDTLLGVGGLNSRLHQMRIHNSLSGIREEDRSILDSKISWAIDAFACETRANQLGRVVSIKDFPDLHHSALRGHVDLESLMKLRETNEIQQFRSWLQSAASLPEKELEERLNSLIARLGSFLNSEEGKLIRWMTSVGITLGTQNPAVGAFAGLLDQFLIDKLLDNAGPICFINNLYPSIYTGR